MERDKQNEEILQDILDDFFAAIKKILHQKDVYFLCQLLNDYLGFHELFTTTKSLKRKLADGNDIGFYLMRR